jgi:hypothetical protein
MLTQAVWYKEWKRKTIIDDNMRSQRIKCVTKRLTTETMIERESEKIPESLEIQYWRKTTWLSIVIDVQLSLDREGSRSCCFISVFVMIRMMILFFSFTFVRRQSLWRLLVNWGWFRCCFTLSKVWHKRKNYPHIVMKNYIVIVSRERLQAHEVYCWRSHWSVGVTCGIQLSGKWYPIVMAILLFLHCQCVISRMCIFKRNAPWFPL